jgi:hypothetical protein
MISGVIQVLVKNAAVQAVAQLNRAGDKYKVYPIRADQGESVPYITVRLAQNDPVTNSDKEEPSHLDYARVNVTCFSTTYREVELMAEACRSALDYFSGTEVGYHLQKMYLVDEVDGFEPSTTAYSHSQIYAVELKRNPGVIYNYLQEEGFTYWGGLWNWADNGNALPSVEVLAGKIWVTEDDRGEPGDENYYPAGTLMTATVDGASTFAQFNFNLA